jgi:hypothetical protein
LLTKMILFDVKIVVAAQKKRFVWTQKRKTTKLAGIYVSTLNKIVRINLTITS